jgi:hexosaminidase
MKSPRASARRSISDGFWCLWLAGLLAAQASAQPVRSNDAPLSARWKLQGDLADNRFEAELTLHNRPGRALAAPWTLYFSSSMQLDPRSVAAPLALRHVNGDLYALRAGNSSPPIHAGQALVVRLTGSPWAINVTDAPSGLYLVPEDESGAELAPVPVALQIAPFPASEKIRRGSDDRVPVVTSASRFAENESLTQLPMDELPPVIPTPIAFTRSPGTVDIDASTTIAYQPSLANEAKSLAASAGRSFAMRLAEAKEPAAEQNSIRLRLGDVTVAGMERSSGDEAYTLTVKPGAGIEIIGTDPAGVFYGIQSLRGLLPVQSKAAHGERLSIPAIEIADAPRFRYRGLHLDVARNFQRVETVKKLLDLMAFYKLNRFHWHLTDDEGWRIEIKSLPELTKVSGRRGHTRTESDRLIPSYGSGPFPDGAGSTGSGYYTQAEFIDVLRYADARHIVVIPEIDVPGHSRAAIKAMAARSRTAKGDQKVYQLTDPGDTSTYESVQGWRDNVMDVGRDDAYEFLDVVIGEIADLYRRAGLRLESVHLGGDEVPHGAWDGSPACRTISTSTSNLTRDQQLEVYFLKRACGLVDKHHAQPACWDDCVLLAAADTDWPRRPVVYVWNNVWGWGREQVAYRLANAGFDVVLANATNLYFDLATEKDPLEQGYYWAGFVDTRTALEFNPLDFYRNAERNSMGQPIATDQFANSERLTTAGSKHILGIQGALWGENLRSPAMLEYMAFPRTIALAERAWAAEPKSSRLSDRAGRKATLDAEWNVFANTLGQRELPRLGQLSGEVGYRVPPPGAVIRHGRLYANVAFPGLVIRYTTDGSEPTIDSEEFTGPIDVPAAVRLRAFDASGHGSRSVEVNSTSSGESR